MKLEENIEGDIKSVKFIHHTLRPWGIDGAGRENLPLATTAWNNQRGENTNLQIAQIQNQLKIAETRVKHIFCGYTQGDKISK